MSDRLDVEGLGSLQSLRAFLRSFLLGKDEAALDGLVKDMVEQRRGLWVGSTPLLATEALLYVFQYALEDTEDSSGGDTWIIPPPPPPRSPLARYDPRNAAGEQPEAVRSLAEEKVGKASRAGDEAAGPRVGRRPAVRGRERAPSPERSPHAESRATRDVF